MTRSVEHDHFFHLQPFSDVHEIEVVSGSESISIVIPAVPSNRTFAGCFTLVDQNADTPSEGVVYNDPDADIPKQRVDNGRGRSEWIGEILGDTELFGTSGASFNAVETIRPVNLWTNRLAA